MMQSFAGNTEFLTKGFKVSGINIHCVQFRFRESLQQSFGVVVTNRPTLFSGLRFAASSKQDILYHAESLEKRDHLFFNYRLVVNFESPSRLPFR